MLDLSKTKGQRATEPSITKRNYKPLQMIKIILFLLQWRMQTGWQIIHTWAKTISPSCEKYLFRSSSVLFQGKPSTIRSLHLWLSKHFVFAIGLSKTSSPFLLFSTKKNTKQQFNKLFASFFREGSDGKIHIWQCLNQQSKLKNYVIRTA